MWRGCKSGAGTRRKMVLNVVRRDQMQRTDGPTDADAMSIHTPGTEGEARCGRRGRALWALWGFSSVAGGGKGVSKLAKSREGAKEYRVE